MKAKVQKTFFGFIHPVSNSGNKWDAILDAGGLAKHYDEPLVVRWLPCPNQDGRRPSCLLPARRQTTNCTKTFNLTCTSSVASLVPVACLCAIVCVCVCPMPSHKIPGVPARELKRVLHSMPFNLTLHSRIANEPPVPPLTSRTHSASQSTSPPRRATVAATQRTDKCTQPPSFCERTHPAEPWDLLYNLSRTLSPGKNMFYHFISFFCAASIPLLSHSATCSSPPTPALKSQATSRALTAASCSCCCHSAANLCETFFHVLSKTSLTLT